MAEIRIIRPKIGLKVWLTRHFLAVSCFVVGVIGVIVCAYSVPDEQWKITSISYFCAIAACAVVCLVCKRGHLYYKSIEDDIKESLKKSGKQDSPSNCGQSRASDAQPLIQEGNQSSGTSNDNPTYRDNSSLQSPNEDVRQPPPGFKDTEVAANIPQPDNEANVIVVQVHHSRDAPGPSSPMPASSEGNGSSSSNPVASDPQISMSTLDSGVAQSSTRSPQSSGDQRRPPPTETHF